MSEEGNWNWRGPLVKAAAPIFAIAMLPVGCLGTTTIAGYLDCRSGNPIYDGIDISGPDHEACDPRLPLYADAYSEYGTQMRLRYAHGHGRHLREYYGHFALLEVTWARLGGVRPQVYGGLGRED